MAQPASALTAIWPVPPLLVAASRHRSILFHDFELALSIVLALAIDVAGFAVHVRPTAFWQAFLQVVGMLLGATTILSALRESKMPAFPTRRLLLSFAAASLSLLAGLGCWCFLRSAASPIGAVPLLLQGVFFITAAVLFLLHGEGPEAKMTPWQAILRTKLLAQVAFAASTVLVDQVACPTLRLAAPSVPFHIITHLVVSPYNFAVIKQLHLNAQSFASGSNERFLRVSEIRGLSQRLPRCSTSQRRSAAPCSVHSLS